MTTKTQQPVIFENGACVILPPNPTIVNVNVPTSDELYEQSATKRYPLNAMLWFADGRIFRYGKIGATSTSAPIARLVCNANACPSATGYVGTDGFEGNLYAAAATGAEYVDLWVIVAASGTGYITSAWEENFFEDGMLAVYPTGHYVEYRINRSDAGATPKCRVYLDTPLKTALTVGTTAPYVTTGTLTESTGGTGVTAYRSIFSQLKTMDAEGGTYTTPMGVCLASGFTADYYVWVQRRGRCIITPTAYFGDSANERGVYYNPSDGTIGTAASYDPSTGYICLGYLTQRTVSGYGDLEVFLTLE